MFDARFGAAIMFPAPIPVLFNVIPIVSVVIDWDHNYYITINEPHIRFEYTPPPKPNNPNPQPIQFRQLSLITHIQTATMAERMQ